MCAIIFSSPTFNRGLSLYSKSRLYNFFFFEVGGKGGWGGEYVLNLTDALLKKMVQEMNAMSEWARGCVCEKTRCSGEKGCKVYILIEQ